MPLVLYGTIKSALHLPRDPPYQRAAELYLFPGPGEAEDYYGGMWRGRALGLSPDRQVGWIADHARAPNSWFVSKTFALRRAHSSLLPSPGQNAIEYNAAKIVEWRFQTGIKHCPWIVPQPKEKYWRGRGWVTTWRYTQSSEHSSSQ